MEKYKKVIKHNKFKVPAPIWNEKLELLDVSCSVSDIRDYFKYIIKKHKPLTDNPPISVHENKIENRITFRIKKGYYLELLTPETMKLIGNI